MKRAIFIFLLLLNGLALKAQITTYKVTKMCVKYYDNELGAWGDWSDWIDINEKDGNAASLEISANGIKVYNSHIIVNYFGLPYNDEINGEFLTVSAHFESDIASETYSFDKKLTFNETNGKINKGQIGEVTSKISGSGEIYVKTNLQELLSGSFNGTIYLYRESGTTTMVSGFRIESP
jgi:hypothetical protein